MSSDPVVMEKLLQLTADVAALREANLAAKAASVIPQKPASRTAVVHTKPPTPALTPGRKRPREASFAVEELVRVVHNNEVQVGRIQTIDRLGWVTIQTHDTTVSVRLSSILKADYFASFIPGPVDVSSLPTATATPPPSTPTDTPPTPRRPTPSPPPPTCFSEGVEL
jgi:hypothetical protein